MISLFGVEAELRKLDLGPKGRKKKVRLQVRVKNNTNWLKNKEHSLAESTVSLGKADPTTH